MRVLRKPLNENLVVYGVYASSKGPMFCVSPPGYKGLLVLDYNSVSLIETEVSDNFVFHRFDDGYFGIFCKILVEDNMLSDLFELDADAYRRFIDYLGREP